MSLFSLAYLIFIVFGLLLYYLLPQKVRPVILLLMSIIFVFSNSIFGFLVVILTSLIAFVSAKKISAGQNKKRHLIFAVVAEIVLLFCLKYLLDLPIFSNAITVYNNTFVISSFVKKYIYPIGMSYFVLQIISYVLDVYWEKAEYEEKYWKLLLFCCYFPQLIQGPISKYGQLSKELFKKHEFKINNIKFGVQLALYGLIKKVIIADRASAVVNTVFNTDNAPKGLVVVFGLVMYGIQLYCDFSGGIDIVRGISQCFDVALTDNFRQPFFSLSLGDFWRRWHISLGQWMKDYVFYPLSISKTFGKLKNSIKKKTDRKFANRIIMSISDIIVFSLVGIWHGLGTNFFAWGLYNGVILAVSAMLTDRYLQWKNALHIKSDSKGWTAFSLFRTLVIITVGWVFDCAVTAKGSLKLFVDMFMITSSNFGCYTFNKLNLLVIGAFFCLVLLVDVLHEKNINIREYISNKPFIVQLIFWTVVLQIIIVLWETESYGGFMYANF